MNISPNSVLSRETIVTLGSKLAPSAAILGRLRLLGLRRADCCDARGRLPEERFEFPIRALDISGVRPNFCAVRFCGLVAQLDRALGFEPRGRGFESLRVYHAVVLRRRWASRRSRLASAGSNWLPAFLGRKMIGR